MKATHIGKTIIVWNKQSDENISELIESLKAIINVYRDLTKYNKIDKPIPIKLLKNNQYLCIVEKNREVFVCATKINKDGCKIYNYSPVINGDDLFYSLPLLKKCHYELKNKIYLTQHYPNTKWIKLPSIKSFEEYLLTPNINPESFIHGLKNNTLSKMSKQFLEDVGISLQKSDFSKDLQNSIDDINSILEER